MESANTSCTLPYPGRFNAAVEFAEKPPKGSKVLSDESKLVLYALYQQATEGPCTQPKPWGWNIVENAKWQSWKQLGDLSGTEAMRLYVRALEDAEPSWWSILQQSKTEQAALQAAADKLALWPPQLAQAAQPAAWVALDVGTCKVPSMRYDHAMTRIATQVYVVGGSYGGRYLGDVWVLDIERLQWRPVSCTSSRAEQPQAANGAANGIATSSASFQPLAGHRLVGWGTNVLCIGGHTKVKKPKMPITAWVLDTSSMSWSLMTTQGPAPVNRSGHSATLIGKKVYVFGGEDVQRRPLGDLWVLDLETKLWNNVQTQGAAPRERSAHIAAVYRNRWMLLFGGGSLAHCFNDLHVLDTETLEWSKPAVEGKLPSARAGCAGGLLVDKWYVMGGGDNSGGCTDIVVLDIKRLPTGGPVVWELVENVGKQSPIACEGMGLVPVPTAALLLAFGGYNGKYHNTVHLYQPANAVPEPEGPTSPKTPASSSNDLPAKGPTANGSNQVLPSKGSSSAPRAQDTPKADAAQTALKNTADLQAALAAAHEALQKAEAGKEAASHEVALLRRQLASAQTALTDADKNTASVKAQLEAESNRAFKLEVEMAELKRQLEKMKELERELEKYRIQAREAEASKSKAGIWSYISGAT